MTKRDVRASSEQHNGTKRALEVRHLVMIALGGVIGSGLFVSSGYTIGQAGPLGAVLAYVVLLSLEAFGFFATDGFAAGDEAGFGLKRDFFEEERKQQR